MKDQQDTKFVVFKISPENHRKLKVSCNKRCSTMTAAVNRLIEDYLMKEEVSDFDEAKVTPCRN